MDNPDLIYKVPPPVNMGSNPMPPKSKFPHLILGIVLLLAVAAAIVAGIYYWQTVRNIPDIIDLPVHKERPVCIQVIATAKNPQTGETREFPTPCDVPEGWEQISP